LLKQDHTQAQEEGMQGQSPHNNQDLDDSSSEDEAQHKRCGCKQSSSSSSHVCLNVANHDTMTISHSMKFLQRPPPSHLIINTNQHLD
jgi:hypothetical protein